MRLANTFDESRNVLRSGDHRPMSMAMEYRSVGERLGIDFSPTVRFLELMPVFMDGAEHKRVRAAMARIMSSSRERQELAVQRSVSESAFHFAQAGQVELLRDLIRPMWLAVSAAITGPDTRLRDLTIAVPSLFCCHLRLQERIRINSLLSETFAEAADADELMTVLGLASLGMGPLTGSMALSLHHVLSKQTGRYLGEIEWPESFQVSALEVTDRLSASEDDTVRCVLHSKNFSGAENAELLFGGGIHLCLGKAISLHAWKVVTSMLARAPTRIETVALDLRYQPAASEHDFTLIQDPFLRPRAVEVLLET